MKKQYAIFTALFIVSLLFTACNNTGTKDSDPGGTVDNGEINDKDHRPDKEDPVQEEDDEAENQPLTAEELSNQIIKAIIGKDMKTVADHVHPENGLLFSPYVYVKDDAVVIKHDEIANLLESDEIFTWGVHDGSGAPIELTPAQYFEEFLDLTLFEDPDEILINDLQERGNTLNNIATKFPNAKIVEFYNEGSEEFSGMDWSSVLFVFEEKAGGTLQLIAIIRDMWTI